MDKRKISIAITSWQRYSETLESFAEIANDERVSEIIIVDDASDLPIFKNLELALSFCPKVKLFRNINNRDCYINKMTAVSYCNNPFCIIWDSDNKLTKDYLDKLFAIKKWDKNTVYQPSWAMPLFDFRAYSGLTITKENVCDYIDKPMFSTLLNAMNYFVNRDKYIEVWQKDIDPHTADSILQNYNHLKSGGSIYVVPEMFYEHRVHDGSHYKKNVHKTGNLYKEIEDKLRQLK
jgi:glycosyltransferase involved in cell wall biosynthesis